VIVSDTNFAVSARRIDLRHAMHVFDGDVAIGHHVYHQLPIGALIDALLARVPLAAAPAAIGRLRRRVRLPLHRRLPRRGSRRRPIEPHDIATAVNALLRRHDRCHWPAMSATACSRRWTSSQPSWSRRLLRDDGLRRAGRPGAAGGDRQRPIILVGDGAFQMTGWELGTPGASVATRSCWVFNNASWEMLRTFEPAAHFNDLGRWDFASMAAGMGGDGHTVGTRAELTAALARAHATRGRFQLLDIRLEPGTLSPTLARFVQCRQATVDA